jgi:hypothetical protein
MFASHRIARPALLSCAVLLAACAKKENAAADSSSMAASTTSSTTTAAPAPAAPAPINLADVAGKWNMRAAPTSGTDTTPTTYVLTATNNTSGWTITFPGRKPQPVQIVAQGDSILITSPAPYASARRKGVQVTTAGVLRLQNGDLAGTTTAHYRVKTPDSVLVLSVTGTRTK